MEQTSLLFRYGVASIAVGVVIGAKLILEIFTGTEGPYLLSIAAVMASAYFGGFGPGLAVTISTTLFSLYLFVSSEFSFSLEALEDGLDVLILFIEGVFISVACTRLIKHPGEETHMREEQEAFIANIVHELRNPLSVLLTWTDLLPSLSPDQREQSQGVIRRNLEVMNRLVEDLVDFSKLSYGNVRMEPTVHDFSEVVATAVEGMEPEAKKKGLELRTAITPGLTLKGDPARLHQVVTNLVNNAIKFTDEGFVSVTVKDAGTDIRLVVQDTGIGVRPESIDHLFYRFWQEKRGPGTAGLGMGLWVVQQIVRLHSGKVRVESEGEGRGTTFTVLLPK